MSTEQRSGTRRVVVTIAVWGGLLIAAGIGWAGDWPGWRGTTGNGTTAEKDLPLTWGGKSNENVLWKVEIGGRSYSSPIVWGDRLFVTDADRQSDQDVKNKIIPEQRVICYATADGKEVWRTKVPSGPWFDGNSIYTAPTPVTDGKLVYAWFGSGVLAALDFDGKIIWRREHAGPYNVYPSITSSPVLYGDNVLILCDQNKDSFLLAVDKKTGEVRWEEKRPKARGTNSSPILLRVKDRDELIVCGGDALEGLDPANGKRLWWCDKDGGYWTSFTFGSGLLYADSGGGRGLAVDPSGEGDVNKTHVKWQQTKVPEGLGCPIIVEDYVYRAHKPGLLRCSKLSTGEVLYSERLEGISYLASPFATPDGRIYFASPGKSYVVKAGPKFEVLATSTLPGGDDGPSPAVAGGRIFLKSSRTLFCIGKK
jgi:outer membrane protein assembly factor BamB